MYIGYKKYILSNILFKHYLFYENLPGKVFKIVILTLSIPLYAFFPPEHLSTSFKVIIYFFFIVYLSFIEDKLHEDKFLYVLIMCMSETSLVHLIWLWWYQKHLEVPGIH